LESFWRFEIRLDTETIDTIADWRQGGLAERWTEKMERPLENVFNSMCWGRHPNQTKNERRSLGHARVVGFVGWRKELL
jgi:hypothetical protein